MPCDLVPVAHRFPFATSSLQSGSASTKIKVITQLMVFTPTVPKKNSYDYAYNANKLPFYSVIRNEFKKPTSVYLHMCNSLSMPILFFQHGRYNLITNTNYKNKYILNCSGESPVRMPQGRP
jgi:hypothetical protein